jgi:hypothetical protein
MALRAGLTAAAVACILSPARAQLIITPTFDPAVPAAMQTEVNQAISNYQNLYTDNMTISILFRYSTTGPDGTPLSAGTLAQSNSTVYSIPYATYTASLAADTPKSSNDTTALAHIPAASAFPNNPTQMDVSSSNGRSVSLGTPGAMNNTGAVGTGGTFDGIVTLNSSKAFSFTRPVGGSQFDALQAIQHEMDEVMGFGSILPSTSDSNGPAVRPEDLFRYSSPGTLSLSSSGSVSSYFSIDGGNTNLVAFNQNSSGDFGDWGSNPTPLVQLAFSSAGTQSDVTFNSPEGVGLDVIGYNLNPAAVPEPGTLALVTLSGIAIAWRRWRR